jgi:hypothetical protein
MICLGKISYVRNLKYLKCWAIWGYLPLTNHHSSEGEQWGRDEIYPDMCVYVYISIYL